MSLHQTKPMILVLLISTVLGCSPFGKGSSLDFFTTTIEWAATDYNLGNQNIGEPLDTTFSLVNTGFAFAQECSSVDLSDNVNFQIISSNCNSTTMLPKASCDVVVRSNPITSGPKILSISRKCKDNQNEISTTVNLTLNAVQPNLSWNENTFDFDIMNIGDSSEERTYTITNNGTGPAKNCGLVSITDATNFSITNDTCGLLDLAPGASCTVGIIANPQSAGILSTSISRTCSIGGTVSTTTNGLTITGQDPLVIWDGFSPNVYDFGEIMLTDFYASEMYFGNYSPDDATSCTAPVLDDTTHFEIINDYCDVNATVAYDYCGVEVKARPTTLGLQRTKLRRSCVINGNTYTAVLNVKTTGLPAEAKLRSYNTSIGNLYKDQETVFNFNIYNEGVYSATGCSAPVFTANSDFQLLSDGCGTSDLAAKSSCVLQIKAKALNVGPSAATVSRSCQVGGSTTSQVQMTVINPAIWLPENLNTNFGLVKTTMQSDVMIYKFVNSSTAPLTNCNLTTLSNTTDFSIVTDTCSTSNVGALNFCYVGIKAHPQSIGYKSTVLSRSCDYTNAVTYFINADGVNSAEIPSKISHGESHSCVLMSNQKAKCWGSSSWGQVGNTSFGFNSVQSVSYVTNLNTAVDIQSDSQYSCALLNDDTLKCWGRNNEGQLGNGSVSPYLNAATYPNVVVSGVSGVQQFDLGERHGCAVLSDNTIKCWGVNTYGQLGDGTTTSRPTAITVSGISTAIQVSAGVDHSCAVLNDGTVQCWGLNDQGQLGNGTTTSSNNPVIVAGLNNVIKVVAGAKHTCALQTGSLVKCWGENTYGELGNGTTVSSMNAVAVTVTGAISDIYSSGYHTCTLMTDQTVKCWGRNNFGQINGTYVDQTVPLLINNFTSVISLSTSKNKTCGLLSVGSVRCWGGETDANLGISRLPTQVTGLSNVNFVSAGYAYACALVADQTVKCWGLTSDYRLGSGDESTFGKSPTTVAGVSAVTQLFSGSHHSCVILSDQTVKCWGSAWGYRAGSGVSNYGTTPIAIPSVSNAVDLGLNDWASCVVINDGTVKCWGSNDGAYAFGVLPSTPYVSATILPGISSVSKIKLGINFACTLMTDQTVQCWGMNDQGQLGDTTNVNRSSPSPVVGLSNVIKIDAGRTHACALINDGTMKCWGYNGDGQVDSTYINKTSPVTVSGLSNIVDIDLGDNYTCALQSDGVAKCFGANHYGQQGTYTSGSSSIPRPKIINTSILKLGQTSPRSAGFSCFIDVNHQVWCSGQNNVGQSGSMNSNYTEITGF